jgi:DNA-binding beta-propeller fold protein YncE
MRTPEIIIPDSAERHAAVRLNVRGVWLAAVLLFAASGLGCGDQFRPVALPIPLPPPNPAPAHFVASLSANGALDPGSLSRIDVSGDSVSSIATTGVAPVHAEWLPNGTKIYVANSGEDTISATSTANPIAATTITLPQLCNPPGCASRPVFVTTTENGKMYVANSANGTMAVINTTSDTVVAETAVDPTMPVPNPTPQPVALVELPNAQKIYSVNQGNNTVTSFSTVDDTVLTTIAIAAPPFWAVASSDSADVYVLDTSGTISVIDTLADAVVATTAVGAGANFMFLDTVGNRIYVTNPTAASVSIFDVAGPTLTPHAGSPVAIAAAAGSTCSSTPMPTSVNVLADDSKAYVASFQADPSGSVCTQATVVNTANSAVTTTIPLAVGTDMSAETGCSSARFRVFATSAPGGANSNFRVYISQCDAGSVAVIDTFASNTGTNPHPADVMEAIIPAPLSTFPSAAGQTTPPLQNPVFVTTAP